MRKLLLIVASVVVSGVLLWLALRDVPLADVAARVAQADPLWALLTLAGITGGLWTRAIRWRGLLGFRVATGQAFHIVNIGFLLNQLPLRAGELARSLLATRSGVPVVTAATSILVERLLDTVLVVIMLVVVVSRAPNAPPTVTRAIVLFGAAAVAAFVVLIVFARYPQLAHRLLEAVEARVAIIRRLRLVRLVDHVLAGLRPLTDARSAAHAVVWTLISWAFSLATFYAAERALNITVAEPISLAALSVSLIALGIAIPVSVAGVGAFQGAVRVAGEVLGVAAEEAAALGFLYHGLTLIGYGAWGVIGLLVLGVSLGDMLRGDKPAAQPSPVLTAED